MRVVAKVDLSGHYNLTNRLVCFFKVISECIRNPSKNNCVIETGYFLFLFWRLPLILSFRGTGSKFWKKYKYQILAVGNT